MVARLQRGLAYTFSTRTKWLQYVKIPVSMRGLLWVSLREGEISGANALIGTDFRVETNPDQGTTGWGCAWGQR